MRLTIIRDDNMVMLDGAPLSVDCSGLPADLHAVQWDGAAGEVEYGVTRCDHCGSRSKKANEFITDLAPYQSYVDGWHAEKARLDAEAAAAEAKKLADAEAAAAEKSADAAGPQG